MRKQIAIVATILFLFTGCVSAEDENAESAQLQPDRAEQGVTTSQTDPAETSDEAGTRQEIEDDNLNIWLEHCDSYLPLSGEEWHRVINVIVQDMCATESIDESVVELTYGPGIDPENENVRTYVDTIMFSYSYWRQFVPKEDPKWRFVIASSREDQAWWDSVHTDYTPLTADLDGCQWYDENRFCSSKYGSDEGKTSEPGFVVLWSVDTEAQLLRNDTVFDPGHNGPHWMHGAYNYQHWHELFAEGHATLYEIATHALAGDQGRQREQFSWLSYSRDGISMDATTPAGVVEHLGKCYGNGQECNYFYYGGGAMFHEKLILDYGYENYLAWHENMRDIPYDPNRIMGTAPIGIPEFEAIFEEQFKMTVASFQNGPFAEHVADSFNFYSEKFGYVNG